MSAKRPCFRQAAILAGGRGTRLGELTRTTPKPLLPCGDRPFLAWILGELARYEFAEVLLLTGHLADSFEETLPAIRRMLPKPMRIACLREAEPAGTGGALFNARRELDQRFLLCNGDSWFDCDLRRLLDEAEHDPPGTAGRVLLREVPDSSRYGVVETAGDHVTAFRHRPAATEDAAPRPGIINAGIYAFDRSVLDDVSPVCSLERDVLPELAARRRLRGTVLDGYFIDIGIPADLLRAQTELPARLLRATGSP